MSYLTLYGRCSDVQVDLSFLLKPCGNFSSHRKASSRNSAQSSADTTPGTTTNPSRSRFVSQSGLTLFSVNELILQVRILFRVKEIDAEVKKQQCDCDPSIVDETVQGHASQLMSRVSFPGEAE